MSRVVVLVPAWNEEAALPATLTALCAQTRLPDVIVVVPNGCTDRTAEVARQFPVIVLELPRLAYRKAEALNRAWLAYAQDADVVVCVDADTVLSSNAIEDWERELTCVAGSSSRFTMTAPGLLSRLQKAEFATWTQTALDRGETHVLAGTGCAIRGDVLRTIAARPDREGPWSYASMTEDFELTYRIREAGFVVNVSPTVRAITDAMPTVRALWGQRMKWQVGTVSDLLVFGVNRLTLRDWAEQALGLVNVLSRLLWLACLLGALAIGQIAWWWFMFPLIFVATDVRRSLRVPYRDWKDVLIAASLWPNEMFMWLRGAWFVWSWITVLKERLTGRVADRWALQAQAEGV